ncbi:chloride channel protein [Castellaniella caeni]|uniref:chloride channel protein n=1 Tax=Castellaniella caeni TaxID=266123 RepID=UPI000C9F2A2B|nr:chloride channel protein [Castellaniella caeni]
MLATVVQWLVLASLVGLVVGVGVSVFLHALFASIDQALAVPRWAYWLMLPAAGLANGLLMVYGYQKLGTSGLKDSIFAAVHEQKGRMPWRTLAIKPVAAIITLACGGSAGKEGPCSHLGASLAAVIGNVFRLNAELRQRIVACGVSAGFASVFGTPIAGAIYGVEMLIIGRIRHDFLFPALIAGMTSFQVSKALGIPYEYYRIPALPEFSESIFLRTVLIGMLCGVVARIFVDLIYALRDACQRLQVRFGLWKPLMPMLGGVVLAALVTVIPTDYLGLSLPLMDRALQGEAMPYLGFLWKSLLVAVTLGSGFYGGIVTPQFVIGAVAGNAFAHLFGISPMLGAAVGLVSVVAAASNTPLAAILMGVELFGGVVGTVYVSGAAIAAYLIIGHRSVYPDQRLGHAKSSWLRARTEIPVGQEKTHLSYGLLKSWRQMRAQGWRAWLHGWGKALRQGNPHDKQP